MSMDILAKGLDVQAERHRDVRARIRDKFDAVQAAFASGDQKAGDEALSELKSLVDAVHALVEASHETARAMCERVVPAYGSEPSTTEESAPRKGRSTRTSVPAGE